MLFQSMYVVEGRGSMDSSSKKCGSQSEFSPIFFRDIHDFVGNGVVGMIESTGIFC